jgi:RNA polymerase sigma factor (sigma-70 family)
MEQSIRWHAVAGAYEHHRDRLVSSLARLYPRAVVEDVVQDLFLRLARIGFGDPGQLTDRYLWRAANRAVRRRIRVEERRLDLLHAHAEWAGGSEPAMDPEHAGPGSREAAGESLARALSGVDARELEVFRMLICQGMTYREAACALGAPEHEITNLRVRGLRRVRERTAAAAG